MRRLALLLLALAAVFPADGVAHPLGNFTVNRYAAIELSGDRIYLHYAVDLAEIPAYQEGKRFRRSGIATQLARNLELTVDGGTRALRVLDARLESRPGAGGLETLRFDAIYDAGPGGAGLAFRDRNFSRRLGWREVVVRAARGAQVLSSSAPSLSVSDALRAYPKDLLREPPQVTSAKVTFRPGTLSGQPPALGRAQAAERAGKGFESLIAQQDVGPGVIALSLLLALFWGAAHALTPGHGKAIVAAYLVGAKGRARHAFALGGIVTVTHTIGVFALGLVTLALSELVVPEDLYPWLNLVAALLVVAVGVTVLRQRLLGWAHARDGHHHGDGHQRHHDHHHHHHQHDHEPAPRRGLIAVGVSGGLLPCPTALVVLLAAISLHRVGFGLLLIVAFSVGLASVITGIGLLAVSAKRAFSRLSFEGALVRALPAISAAAIVALGLVMTFRSLPAVT
jgi:ABC-type nickel/cobalt efflux system permease component RcnA